MNRNMELLPGGLFYVGGPDNEGLGKTRTNMEEL